MRKSSNSKVADTMAPTSLCRHPLDVMESARRIVVAAFEGIVLGAVSGSCGVDVGLGHEVGAPHDPHRRV
jgi:hypothetical protein